MTYALTTTVGALSSGTRGSITYADGLGEDEHIFVPDFDRSYGVTVVTGEVVLLRSRTRNGKWPNRAARRVIDKKAAQVLANLRNNG